MDKTFSTNFYNTAPSDARPVKVMCDTGMFLEGSRTSLSTLKLVLPYWNNVYMAYWMTATQK